MSLFPAYSDASSPVPSTSAAVATSKTKPSSGICIDSSVLDESWLENDSFIAFTATSEAVPKESPKKKRKKTKREKPVAIFPSDLEKATTTAKIEPNSEFYVDQKGIKSYLTVQTLYKPACPRYKLSRTHRFRRFYPKRNVKFRRYHLAVKKVKETNEKCLLVDLSPEEERHRLHLKQNPHDVDGWIKYIEFKDVVTARKVVDDYQRSKMRLDLIERAQRLNPSDDDLLKLYLETIVRIHPTDEVLDIIERLVNKDPNNFLTWSALIYNKQASMAQCIVPDVLSLYEKCMKALFSAVKNDELLLKIFKNCALFMRQCGLWEQFFALVHLALNLNISPTAFADRGVVYYSKEVNHTLIEYEELILGSGLPMNEIWLRVEKLRAAFNFLPCWASVLPSDPQRVVLNEDIAHFIYPLMTRHHAFDMFVITLRLVKYPFPGGLFEHSPLFRPEIHEQDSIEDILSIYLAPKRSFRLDLIVFNLVKELSVPPNFTPTNLAAESFFDLLVEILISAMDCFIPTQNRIILLLYLRLERIALVLERLHNAPGKPLEKEAKKRRRGRVKKVIKNSKFQNDLAVYNEYAWIEYEMEGAASAESIFRTMIAQSTFVGAEEFFAICLNYAELLLVERQREKSICLLTGLALGKVRLDDEEHVADTKRCSALQKFTDRLKVNLELALEHDRLDTEAYFLPSELLNAARAKAFYLLLIKSDREAFRDISELISRLELRKVKHEFIRERLYELCVDLHQLSGATKLPAIIENGISEFPSNLRLLQAITVTPSWSWLRIRAVLGKTPNTNAVIFLVAAARYRSLRFQLSESDRKAFGDLAGDIDSSEDVYKRRIISVLRDATAKSSSVRQNALIWRLYLRALFDVHSDQTLVRCRNTLYEALDVCPWNKALYLDGAFFAPQELSQLLDLILEKQLRIHAIPEELSILRTE